MAEEWKVDVVPLLHPIKVGELSLTEIALREPDLEALEMIEEAGFVLDQRPTVKQIRTVIQALSGQPIEVLRKLHRDDFTTLTERATPLVTGPSEDEGTSDSAATTSTTSPGT